MLNPYVGRSIPIRPTSISITSSRSSASCDAAIRCAILVGCCATSCYGAGYGAAVRCGIGCCTTSCCAISCCGAGCSTTNRSTAVCSTCAGLQPLSNQHFQVSVTSTLQSIVGSAIVTVAPVPGFYSGSCSGVLFWLLDGFAWKAAYLSHNIPLQRGFHFSSLRIGL
jgi:hypothetical protein